MIQRHHLLPLVVCASIVSVSVLATEGLSAGAPSSSASGLASGSAAAPPAADIVRGAELPRVRSEVPTLEEWKNGRIVSANSGNAPCSFKLLREYLQITCKYFAATGLAAGSPKDTTVFASGDRLQGDDWVAPLSIIVVPIREGETRLFNLIRIVGGGYGAVWSTGDAWLEVGFRKGDKDPIILMKNPLELSTMRATSI